LETITKKEMDAMDDFDDHDESMISIIPLHTFDVSQIAFRRMKAEWQARSEEWDYGYWREYAARHVKFSGSCHGFVGFIKRLLRI
jgi:hypothetical protein